MDSRDGCPDCGSIGHHGGCRPPKRRFTVGIAVQGDDWEALEDALHDIAMRLGHEHTRESTNGGVGSGYHFTVTEREGLTHDEYVAELDAWLATKRAESHPPTPDGLTDPPNDPIGAL